MKKNRKKILTVSCFSLFLLISFLFISNSKATENYTNYLYNHSLTIYSDKAMILNELSGASNNYRNYFDSGFIFPSKLSNEMFNAYTTDYTQYSLSQIYLDNLDNEYAFKSNNNSENIITSQSIQLNQTNMINGSIINNEIHYETILPNQDIITNWNRKPNSSTWFEKINKYPLIDNFTSIEGISGISTICEFGLQNVSFSMKPIVNIEFRIFCASIVTGGQEQFIDIRINGFWYKEITLDIGGDYQWYSYNYSNLDFTTEQINNMTIKVRSTASGVGRWNITSLGIILTYDYNTTQLINSDSTGISGHYSAIHSFTNDIDDSTPEDFTTDESGGSVRVRNERDLHKKTTEFIDTSGSNDVRLEQTFTNQPYGTVELWFQTNDTIVQFDVLVLSESTSMIVYLYTSAGYLRYYDGIGHDIVSIGNNCWQHIRVDFECGSGSYQSLPADCFYVYVNDTQYGHYGSWHLSDNINEIEFGSNSVQNKKMYLDAIDYSWDIDYYFGRNKYDITNRIYFILESQINYLDTSIYTAFFLNLYIKSCCNYSILTKYYIYDYDLDLYNTIFSNSFENQYYIQSFLFNESSQYRLNKFKVLCLTNIIPYSFRMFIKTFTLNITYVKINNLGYHDLTVKIIKRNDASVYKGYYMFQTRIYNNSFQYYYIEYNTDTDDYIVNWQSIQYTSIETFELNTHVRYGLNTLDVEITNILCEVYINSELTLTFMEQDRKYFNGIHYKPEFNYTSQNRNYLNLTGVIGNYSYNCLKGIRCLCGNDGQIYNRFFIVPLFQENIDVQQRTVPQGGVDIQDEPEPPKDASYWTYETFRLVSGTTYNSEVGNWSMEFTPVAVEKYTAKYYYNKEAIDRRSLGNWQFKIGDWKISFNFLRDSLAYVLNLILLFFQYLLYLVVASLSFIFMFLGCYIVAFLYNICIYYIYIGLCYVGWYICVFLLWLWEVVVWIWANIIYPFLEWCYYNLLPAIIDGIIIIIAFLLTCFIYVICLGQIDFWNTYDIVYEILWLIVDFIVEWLLVFSKNMDSILLFLLWYLLNAGLIYFRYLYSRARGNQNRAEQLYYTFQIYISPIVFIWNIIKKLLESTPEA